MSGPDLSRTQTSTQSERSDQIITAHQVGFSAVGPSNPTLSAETSWSMLQQVLEIRLGFGSVDLCVHSLLEREQRLETRSCLQAWSACTRQL